MTSARRVGILTLPFNRNCGGRLQAIALARVIEQLGHDVVVLDKRIWRSPVSSAAGRVLARVPAQNVGGFRGRELARRLHQPSFDRLITTVSPPVRSTSDLEECFDELGLDTVVIGSDQVWRIEYQWDRGAMNFFGGFGTESLRRVAYAASFGTTHWQDPSERDRVAHHLQSFNAISVRESSGVEICAALGRTDALQVLDPTLLLSPAEWRALGQVADRAHAGTLVYAIDHGERIAKALGKDGGVRVLRNDRSRPTLTLETWLSEFWNADTVVTDSFHGTIFAVLFRKNFVAVSNGKRGADRFTSFLAPLGLSDRLVDEGDLTSVRSILHGPSIEYDECHARLADLQIESRAFLKSALQ